MPLTTLVAGNTVTASGLNDNFSACLLKDTSGTVSVTHTFTAAQIFDVASATAITVGPNGATDPTFQVDTNTASAATGLKITGAAAASGVALVVVSSGTNEN